MIVVLSGEGPTDLGQCGNAQNICQDGDFQIGPMTALLDQMLAPRLGYSPRTTQGGYLFVSEGALVVQERARKNERRKVSLVGKKRAQETGYFYINAWMLADIALEIETERGDKVVAFCFEIVMGHELAMLSYGHPSGIPCLVGLAGENFQGECLCFLNQNLRLGCFVLSNQQLIIAQVSKIFPVMMLHLTRLSRNWMLLSAHINLGMSCVCG